MTELIARADARRAQQWEPGLERQPRDGGGRHAATPPAAAIGLAHHRHQLVLALDQAREGRDRELGRAEEDEAHGGLYSSPSSLSCFFRFAT